MEKRIDLEEVFVEVAKLFAKRSTCLRKHVGAVLVKDRRIISTGFNGVPHGMEHCEVHFRKHYEENKLDYGFKNFDEFVESQRFYDLHHAEYSMFENHAEVNCIGFASKSGIATEGSELYVTLSPCLDCAKLIVSAGVTSVYYIEEYDRDNRSIKFLERFMTVRKVE